MPPSPPNSETDGSVYTPLEGAYWYEPNIMTEDRLPPPTPAIPAVLDALTKARQMQQQSASTIATTSTAQRRHRRQGSAAAAGAATPTSAATQRFNGASAPMARQTAAAAARKLPSIDFLTPTSAGAAIEQRTVAGFDIPVTVAPPKSLATASSAPSFSSLSALPPIDAAQASALERFAGEQPSITYPISTIPTPPEPLTLLTSTLSTSANSVDYTTKMSTSGGVRTTTITAAEKASRTVPVLTGKHPSTTHMRPSSSATKVEADEETPKLNTVDGSVDLNFWFPYIKLILFPSRMH